MACAQETVAGLLRRRPLAGTDGACLGKLVVVTGEVVAPGSDYFWLAGDATDGAGDHAVAVLVRTFREQQSTCDPAVDGATVVVYGQVMATPDRVVVVARAVRLVAGRPPPRTAAAATESCRPARPATRGTAC